MLAFVLYYKISKPPRKI